MIRLSAEVASPSAVRADVVACMVFEDDPLFRQEARRLESDLGISAQSLSRAGFTGKFQQTLALYPSRMRASTLLLVGGGKSSALTLERLRRLACTAARSIRHGRGVTLALMEPDPEALPHSALLPADDSWEAIAVALAEGVVLGRYRYDRYRTVDRETEADVARLVVATRSRTRRSTMASGLRRAEILTSATCLARDLANAPGNEIYPATLAGRAAQEGRRVGVRVRVLDEGRIRALKMGGLLGVGSGSERPPRFVIMEWKPRRTAGTVVLVGKGITFDSGGISIKPSASMAEMKMDMSGAAAVIATLVASARLKVPLHVVGLIPAAENLPSGRALKPGDIITHYSGLTSEVDNTDAEGRLVLADALAYASRYKPDLVIDLATLTGAVVVALGSVVTGMMGNDEKMMARLKESGERTFERVWQMPLFEEYERLIKSDVADVKNVGGRWAGAITAALFLKKFASKMNWIHLDIAGTAIMEEAFEYIPKGASGVGVRLMVDFLTHWKR